MILAETLRQIDYLIIIGIVVIIFFLIRLTKRVTALEKNIDHIIAPAGKMNGGTEPNKAVHVPANGPTLEANFATVNLATAKLAEVPDAVIVAISAAVNEYRKENI